MNSAIPRFYRLPLAERRTKLADVRALADEDLVRLSPEHGLREGDADGMVENAIGVFGLPLGLCVNLRVDDEDVLVPMAVEEPSVVAACSFASKLLRAGGGVRTSVSEPVMIGQIQVLDVPDPEAAERAVLEATEELLKLADSGHASLLAAGGGAVGIEVRHLAPEEGDPCGPMMIVHLLADVRDAMGANAINSMCERLAPRIEALTGGRVGLRILSNLTDRRTVTVEGRVPFSALEGRGAESGAELARRIEEASVFAERDHYRACTHNKGIMNGVDAALIAFGQDWRAVEAGAHAFAARNGRYGALARWRVDGDYLVGTMILPLAVGTVGGIAKVHPVVGVARRIAGIEDAKRLAAVCAAIGLAQNLAALRALAAEGIQRGHMRLHGRNFAVEAGATGDEVEEVARRIAERGRVNVREAVAVLAELRAERAERSRSSAPVRLARRPRPPTPPTPPLIAFGGGELSPDDSKERAMSEGTRPERDLGGKVLVTGAAGHLGANLVRRLLDEGVEVRVLLRRGSNNAAVDGLDVERVYGDLRDPGSLVPAVRGIRDVFHVAANISTIVANPALEREIYECNVLGTRNLLRAAGEAGVERVVVTGSFSAVGYDLDDRERPSNEDMPFWPFEEVLPYARTKVLVEHETLKACVEGLDCVIATSCAIIGPHDYKPSRMGKTLLDYTHGKIPAYLPGGFDFVAARDIAEGHVLAMKRGRTGQKYIISTQYLEVDELMEIFEEVTGRPRPRLRLPTSVMAGIAGVSSPVMNTFFPDKPQRFTPAAVRLLSSRRRADTSKAQRELGYRPTTIRQAVHEAYADFARRGLVPARPGTTVAAERSMTTPEPAASSESARAAANGR